MKEEYVTYDCAVKLKELGFKDKCNAYYWTEDKAFECTNSIIHKNSDTCLTVVMAPFLWQAQKWLRDCKDVIVIAEPDWDEEIQCLSDYLTGKWYFTVWKDSNRVRCNFNLNKECEEIWLFDTYEQALSAGIDAALELLTLNTK